MFALNEGIMTNKMLAADALLQGQTPPGLSATLRRVLTEANSLDDATQRLGDLGVSITRQTLAVWVARLGLRQRTEWVWTESGGG